MNELKELQAEKTSLSLRLERSLSVGLMAQADGKTSWPWWTRLKAMA